MKNKNIIITLSLLILISWGCEESSETQPGENASFFDFELFKTIESNETKDNFMVSPLSIFLALSMAYNGAEGDTKEAFDQVLRNDMPISVFNQDNQEMVSRLSSNTTESGFAIANSMWIHETLSVRDAFIRLNKDYYDSEVSSLDLRNPASVNVINKWVSDRTSGKVKDMLKEINGVMLLVNTVYFNMQWEGGGFEIEKTRQAVFYKADGSELDVDMMSGEWSVPYLENDLFASIVLPYQGDEFSMVLVLPQEGKTVGDVVEDLAERDRNEWLEAFEDKVVYVEMPKFKMKYTQLLNEALIDMGLGIAFSGEFTADFSGITGDRSLYISRVLHSTSIDVNETGTEAAASTVVEFDMVSISYQRILSLNRPFLFMVKENKTGTFLFMGRVGAPSYDDKG
ncbi:MAG: serpin family protein [Ekhidna sp.]|nr:serpin family protein [Ekhidna sp.]